MSQTIDRPANESGRSADALTRELLRWVEHSLWANLKWAEYVHTQPDPEGRARELLAHIMVGERVWFERIEGEQKSTAVFRVLPDEILVEGFRQNAQTYRELLAGDCERVVQFRRATGEEYHARVLDVITHLLTHGYHHRGQLAALYASNTITYPSTDHIDFLMANRL
ncbi:MAG: DinB family protein [Gemmatimonadota bacterium]